MTTPRHSETNSTEYYQRRAELDALQREAEFQLQREARRTAPQQPAPQNNANTRQTSLFDAGGDDLPGQRLMFPDIETI